MFPWLMFSLELSSVLKPQICHLVYFLTLLELFKNIYYYLATLV